MHHRAYILTRRERRKYTKKSLQIAINSMKQRAVSLESNWEMNSLRPEGQEWVSEGTAFQAEETNEKPRDGTGQWAWNMISQVETGTVSRTQITSLLCLKDFKLRSEWTDKGFKRTTVDALWHTDSGKTRVALGRPVWGLLQ